MESELCTDNVPKLLWPVFQDLKPSNNKHLWLEKYYSNTLKKAVRSALKREFKREAILCPFKKLQHVKDYFISFGSSNQNPRFKELHYICEHYDRLYWKLEMALYRAVFSFKIPMNSQLPSNAWATFRELLLAELVLYMHEGLAELDFTKHHAGDVMALKLWIENMGSNMGVGQEIKLKKKVSPYESPIHGFWYFWNGTSRVPKFIQYEILKLNDIKSNTQYWLKHLRYKDTKSSRSLMIIIWASARFFVDLCYIALMPYRILRTFVNAIATQLFEIIRASLHYRILPNSPNRLPVHFASILAQGLLYISLLYQMNLPILPNPMVWFPMDLLALPIPAIAATYCASLAVFTCYHGLKQWAKKDKDNEPSLEKTAHKQTSETELFRNSPKPILFTQSRREAAEVNPLLIVNNEASSLLVPRKP